MGLRLSYAFARLSGIFAIFLLVLHLILTLSSQNYLTRVDAARSRIENHVGSWTRPGGSGDELVGSAWGREEGLKEALEGEDVSEAAALLREAVEEEAGETQSDSTRE